MGLWYVTPINCYLTLLSCAVAQLLGAKTPSSRGSPSGSGHSWREREHESHLSLLGNDTVRIASAAKRIPGMEPKSKRKHIDKVSGWNSSTG